MFGLGNKDNKKPKKPAAASKASAKKPASKKGGNGTQADEAKAMLAAMEKRKKDRPEDCVFC